MGPVMAVPASPAPGAPAAPCQTRFSVGHRPARAISPNAAPGYFRPAPPTSCWRLAPSACLPPDAGKPLPATGFHPHARSLLPRQTAAAATEDSVGKVSATQPCSLALHVMRALNAARGAAWTGSAAPAPAPGSAAAVPSRVSREIVKPLLRGKTLRWSATSPGAAE